MTQQNEFSLARRLMPPISALAAFEAVARRKSFTAAATELALTQSAVSRQISVLENLLGVPLFEGNRRRQVTLTRAGTFYAERVRLLLSDLAAATTEVIALDGGGRTLRLGIPPTFGSRWLIPRMQEFFSAHPDIAVEFTTRVPGRPNPGLDNLDALIDFSPSPGSGAEWQWLMDLELRPVAAPDLARRLRESEGLTNIQMLVHRTERTTLAGMLDQSSLGRLRGQPMLVFESYAMLIQAAQAGLGIGLAPTVFVEGELKARILVPVGDLAIESPNVGYLVFPAAKSGYPPLEAFRTWLFNAAAAAGGNPLAR